MRRPGSDNDDKVASELTYGVRNITPCCGAIALSDPDWANLNRLGWSGFYHNGDKTETKYPVTEDTYKSQAEFNNALKSTLNDWRGNLIIYIHGGFINMDDSLHEAAEVAEAFHSPVILCSWPSTLRYFAQVYSAGWTHNYESARNSMPENAGTPPEFAKLVNSLPNSLGQRKLLVIAHGMGSIILCRLYRYLDNTVIFDKSVFHGADATVADFSKNAAIIKAHSKTTWVFRNACDDLLLESSLRTNDIKVPPIARLHDITITKYLEKHNEKRLPATLLGSLPNDSMFTLENQFDSKQLVGKIGSLVFADHTWLSKLTNAMDYKMVAKLVKSTTPYTTGQDYWLSEFHQKDVLPCCVMKAAPKPADDKSKTKKSDSKRLKFEAEAKKMAEDFVPMCGLW